MGLSCTGPLRRDSFSVDPSGSNPCSRVNSTAGNPRTRRANCGYVRICDCKVPRPQCYSRVSCQSTLSHISPPPGRPCRPSTRQLSPGVMYQPRQASCFYPKSRPHLPKRCGTATRPPPQTHTLFFKERVRCALHRASGGALRGSVLPSVSPSGSFSATRGGRSLDDCLPFRLTSPPPCRLSSYTQATCTQIPVSTKTFPYPPILAECLLIRQGNTASLLLHL